MSPDLTELESESELESKAESQFEDDTTGIILAAVIGEENEPQTTNVPIVEHAREGLIIFLIKICRQCINLGSWLYRIP